MTPAFAPPDQLQAVQDAVLAMPVARTLKLAFRHIAPGEVELEIPAAPEFSFRPGQLQATAIFAVADFAAVAAAGTLLPPGASNATIDTTLKIVGPAVGVQLRGKGRVVRNSKLLSVCASDVYAVDAQGAETLCATLLATARNIAPA
ncbi:MAG: PaaI family thioesterase [Ottowia sp.]|nr:PaaI family thioesterase [Ottowia sp.]